MMRKILISMLSILSLNALGQTATEEAIILNQEMQFLEDSISTSQSSEISVNSSAADSDSADLEKIYFSDAKEDEIRTKTAAPKRRGF